MSSKPPVICLMGPTASGKTAMAIELASSYPMDIVSVDSAMIYRGMDIGTAKPTKEELEAAPHRLIDIVDPAECYSAGQFRIDALHEIQSIHEAGRIPLLVGGTMMYFRILQQGMAALPKADAAIRASLKVRAEQAGWESLHAELVEVDPVAASNIQPNDSQRIQRALEVYLLTGRPISAIQSTETNPLQDYQLINLGIMPSDRDALHARIATRFDAMLNLGFIAEVEALYARSDLHPDLPSIRSVGYRQAWDYLAGKMTRHEMREKAIIATRQLAKRQMTWLRSWDELTVFDVGDVKRVKQLVSQFTGC